MPLATYSPTGSTDTFTVPLGVTSIQVDMYGGNGGPPWANVTATPTIKSIEAGTGARLVATIPVTPLEVLTIQVGLAGRYGAIVGVNGDHIGGTGVGPLVTGLGGYPDGGNGGVTSGNFIAGGGGGSTRLWRGGVGGTLLACAAGGGGIGFVDGTSELVSVVLVTTGDGGRPAPGQAGRDKDISGIGLVHPGLGGTSGAGGSGGLGASNGGSLSGGAGAPSTLGTFSGGGGGGGRFGGGGGGRESFSILRMGSQGGGGSSFVIGGASGITYSQNPSAATSGNTEALYQVQAGGLLTIDYAPAGRSGWSLGLVKLMG